MIEMEGKYLANGTRPKAISSGEIGLRTLFAILDEPSRRTETHLLQVSVGSILAAPLGVYCEDWKQDFLESIIKYHAPTPNLKRAIVRHLGVGDELETSAISHLALEMALSSVRDLGIVSASAFFELPFR